MNYALPEELSPLTGTHHRPERSLLAKMNVLRERLDNFTVLDRYGTSVGDVRNLVLHQGQLAIVVVQPDAHKHWRFVLLNHQLVERISLRDRVVHVRITQGDMNALPEYRVNPDSASPIEVEKEQPKALAPMMTAQKPTLQSTTAGKESFPISPG
ncbi:MAG: hypothetical protein KME27_25910 [Lyngbya sp. HA4199-MV5]|jgi:hypothetical protein|nr:hypothetical protein [Lyngbya sp. HA4199-MV5]